MLFVYRARASARVRDWVAVGAAFGLVALTRREGPILFVGIVGVTLLLWRDAAARRRLACGAAALSAVVVIMLPWTVRSSIALDGLVLSATNRSTVLAGTYCDSAFRGPLAGLGPRVPACAEARGGRGPVRRPTGQGRAEIREGACGEAAEGDGAAGGARLRPLSSGAGGLLRGGRAARHGLAAVLADVRGGACPFVVAGLLALWRRRGPIGPLVAWLGTCLTLVALTQGANRQRLVFEPVLAILLAGAPLLLARPRRWVRPDDAHPEARLRTDEAHPAARPSMAGTNTRAAQPSAR